MDDERKDHIDPKASKLRNHTKQLLTHNLSTDDGENINSTKKGRNLQFANKLRIWHTNGSPNLGQKTRPYDKQQKKCEFAKLWILLSRWPQNKTERKWKEE